MNSNKNIYATNNKYDSDSDSNDSDVAFANIDFSGVNFDDNATGDDENENDEPDTKFALLHESKYLLPESHLAKETDKIGNDVDLQNNNNVVERIKELSRLLENGLYTHALRSETARIFFDSCNEGNDGSSASNTTMTNLIRDRVISYCTSVSTCVEVEMLGVAALNLFLQLNYTGPNLDSGTKVATDPEDKDPLDGINPHPIFHSYCARKEKEPIEKSSSDSSVDEKNDSTEAKNDTKIASQDKNSFHNTVLSELAVDGEWPCQVCQVPYMLLLSRSILLSLSDPQRPDWTHSALKAEADMNEDIEISRKNPKYGAMALIKDDGTSSIQCDLTEFLAAAKKLKCADIWSARSVVAHQRLLQGDEPSLTLWNEAQSTFTRCIDTFCSNVDIDNSAEKNDKTDQNDYDKRAIASRIMLEWGLAQTHFNQEGKGKKSFNQALEFAGLKIEVTGAEGKRTKFQRKATAQMTVKATSAAPIESKEDENKKETDEDVATETMVENGSGQKTALPQMIEHAEDEILLERIKFEDERNNKHNTLTELDQAILLALCLDVKNTNPMDGLTGEQMGAYLERVLHQHDDWMIYATALLERAWLECERTHARERAILQIQALADQHTNRLTLTQSTFQAVEDSAPPQERLRNLHTIVYPPRWETLRDLAERYAKIGIMTSAAELFTEIELWDEVVECYRSAGKVNKAEEVVRKRLSENETPRMWAALGELTKDPSHYQRALKLSNGRFSAAYACLGQYYFDKGDLRNASDNYMKALKMKPLDPFVWFRLGTISMRLEEWETALHAFSEVVTQEPEEGDAWANVAAVHMHNKNPTEAYPALVESLKQNRNNWRVWVSKLYTCIDLKKYDEAIQACHQLMEFKSKKNESEGIPGLEEKCVRAIIGGSLEVYDEAIDSDDSAAIDSARRTLARVRELLTKISSTLKSEAWIWESCAYFNERIGRSDQVMENLMKEHRALQSIQGWETDGVQLSNVCRVVIQISMLHQEDGGRESLVKCKFLLKSVIKKIQAAYFNRKLPEEVVQLESVLSEVENTIVD